jgi:hypothetical protein
MSWCFLSQLLFPATLEHCNVLLVWALAQCSHLRVWSPECLFSQWETGLCDENNSETDGENHP